MELVLGALAGTLALIAAWVVWTLEGKGRFLRRFEETLPLRGRWLRYLIGVLFFPLVAALPVLGCVVLTLVPAVPGFVV